MPDLVTFGETMLRLSPDGGERIETTDEFRVHVGGSESNVAVAASRLGLDTVWLSKLPNTPLGRRVTHGLRANGITPAVAWSEEGSQGLYYVEPAGTPRDTNAIYDRADAAVTSATPDELEVEHIREADLFFTTGITPALSSTLAETTRTLLKTAREAGVTTAFDFNYRSKLWSPAEAKARLTELFAHVDWFIIAERDAKNILDMTAGTEELPARLSDKFDFETVIVTRGPAGAIAHYDDITYDQPAFEADTIDPIGSGDALVGAFFARRFSGDSVPEALEYGAAAAALKRTIPGDMAVINPEDVDRVLTEHRQEISR